MVKGRTFLTQLYSALAGVSADLIAGTLPPSRLDLRRSQLAALQEIDRYVKAGFWVGQERARERIQYYLFHELDVAKTAAEYNTTEGAIRVAVSSANAKLVAKFGDKLIVSIMEGNVGQALTEFRLATGEFRIMDLLVSDVVTALPAPEYTDKVKLSDCVRELSFLRYFTVENVRAQAKGVDGEKVAFIRYILESKDPAYSFTRQAILNYLKGSISTPEELMSVLGP